MNLKIYFLLVILASMCAGIYGANCGGSVKCSCGDTLTSSYTFSEDLICGNTNGLTIGANNINLDCSGHRLIGSGTNTGIYNPYYDSLNIKNCNIINFYNGIYFNYYIKYDLYGSTYYYPENSAITNNIFSNNTYGLYYRESPGSHQVSQNQFLNNDIYGLYTNSRGSYYANTFSGTGLYHTKTSGFSFSQNGASCNTYTNGALGPSCTCLTPQSGLTIDSSIKLCQDTYHLNSSLTILLGGSLDCQGSNLLGSNTSTALILSGASSSIIQNCNIFNFTTGITITHFGTTINQYKTSYNNQILNNTIYDVSYGILMKEKTYSYGWTGVGHIQNRAENIHNNRIVSDNYSIYVEHNYPINASSNWFGTNDSNYINSKLHGNITYIPFTLLGHQSDLSITTDDINIFEVGNKSYVHLRIKNSGAFYIPMFETKILTISNGFLKLEKNINLSGIYAHSFLDFNIELNISESDEIYVILDPQNNLAEVNENNNYASSTNFKGLLYYLDVNIQPVEVGIEIQNYIKYQLGEYLFTNDITQSSIIIKIGNSNPSSNQPYNNILSTNFLEPLTYESSNTLSYEGEIESHFTNNKMTISIHAKGFEGYLVGTKKLISDFDKYIGAEVFEDFDRYDIYGLGVYDYLHTNYLNPYISILGSLGLVSRSVLYDNMFDSSEDFIEISSPNGITSYKIRKLNSLKSNILKSYIDKDRLPIIMAGGIYSNIDEWSDFGSELANDGFNVYLLELTGGKNAECDDCYDYTYEFLSDDVFPSYINYILNDSKSEKLKYVGHSNGCRVALTGINDNGLSNKFETFVGLGCPVLLNEMSGSAVEIRKEEFVLDMTTGEFKYVPAGDVAIYKLQQEGKKHIYKDEYGNKLITNNPAKDFFVWWFGDSDNKISLNLQDFYNDLYINNNSQFVVQNAATRHLFIAGNNSYGYYPLGLKHYNDDGAVPINDMIYLNNTIPNSSLIISQYLNHGELIKDESVLKQIKEEIR